MAEHIRVTSFCEIQGRQFRSFYQGCTAPKKPIETPGSADFHRWILIIKKCHDVPGANDLCIITQNDMAYHVAFIFYVIAISSQIKFAPVTERHFKVNFTRMPVSIVVGVFQICIQPVEIRKVRP